MDAPIIIIDEPSDDEVESIFPEVSSEEIPRIDFHEEPASSSSAPENENSIDKLKAMFPNIEESYIKQICENPPVSETDDFNDIFLNLVNHLLIYDEKFDESLLQENEDVIDERWIRDHELSNELEMKELAAVQEKFNEEERNEQLLNEFLQQEKLKKQNEEERNELLLKEFIKSEESSVDKKLEILENILPDANPDLLKKIVENYLDDPNLLEEAIESKLVDRNYEKRTEYFAKLRNKMQIEQYTTGFNVEAFLKQFENPIEHFENPNRQCFFQQQALDYLKKCYNILDNTYLAQTYSDFKYNLSLTFKYLRSRIYPHEVHDHAIEDVPLLQELAFIENKNQIQECLNAMSFKEEQELRELKDKKLLLECQCCYDDLKPYESIECNNGHYFCKRCVIRGTDAVISNGEATVQCFMACGTEISVDILRQVLPASTFEKFLKKRQDHEVIAANIKDLENCPFCPYVMELSPEILIFMCKNPECKKITCRKCKKLNHLPIQCEDVFDEHKGRLFVEEEMSKALIVHCYCCQRPFVKDSGCNFMQCRFCQAKWCHICKQPIRDHLHFTNSRCGQFDNYGFDKEQVRIKRDLAISKLRQDFPDIKLPDL